MTSCGYTRSILLVVAGCKKTEDPDPAPVVPASGNVSLRFDNVIGGEAIQLGQIAHMNSAGNSYSVSMLKYCVSNVELVRIDGTVLLQHELS